jgi:hypothetical protein
MLPDDLVRDMLKHADEHWPNQRKPFYDGVEWVFARLQPRINDGLINAVNEVLAQYNLDNLCVTNPNHPIIKLRDAARRAG